MPPKGAVFLLLLIELSKNRRHPPMPAVTTSLKSFHQWQQTSQLPLYSCLILFKKRFGSSSLSRVLWYVTPLTILSSTMPRKYLIVICMLCLGVCKHCSGYISSHSGSIALPRIVNEFLVLCLGACKHCSGYISSHSGSMALPCIIAEFLPRIVNKFAQDHSSRPSQQLHGYLELIVLKSSARFVAAAPGP